MKTKTTLSFTKEELETIYFALNNYALENINQSKTWGNLEGLKENGYREDVWHREAMLAGRLQSRMFKATNRLEKREKETTTAE